MLPHLGNPRRVHEDQFLLGSPAWSRLTDCRFHRTVLAGGAIISGCDVEESVIGVRTVMRDAKIRRSVIMGGDPFHEEDAPAGAPPVGIGRGSVIENAIIDKNVRIGRNVRIVKPVCPLVDDLATIG